MFKFKTIGLLLVFLITPTVSQAFFDRLIPATPKTAGQTNVSISVPTDGTTINNTYTTVKGIASAIGSGESVDLMLVLDDSGSLLDTDPTKERFEAIRQLFNVFSTDTNVDMGLAFFSEQAELAVSMQPLTSAETAILQVIQTRTSPDGGTNIADGIRLASQELMSKGSQNDTQIILVFTDGQDTSSDSQLAAQEAAGKGQVVHVVGLLEQDTQGKTKAELIAKNGNGRLFLASNAAQLSTIFRDSRLVDIDKVTITNTTTGSSAPNVNFAAGNYSGVVDLIAGSNVLKVEAFNTDGQSATAQVTVNVPVAACPDINDPANLFNFKAECPPSVDSYVVKLRPQVLMAGFDPMLIDIGDDQFKIMALIREGAQPIRHVTLSENTGSFAQSMNLEGELPNGDKIYSVTFVGARFTPDMNSLLSNLFGSNPGEFNITVIDAASMEHSFPSVEFGSNRDVERDTPLTSVQAYTTTGTRRGRPQVLMAGFDPALIDMTASSFKVKAIVRRGSTPIRTVTLKTNGNFFSVKMEKEMDLPNGDALYATTQTFPRASFPSGAFRNLFGTAFEGEFVIEAKDEGGQSHMFPALNACDCPEIQ